MRYAPLFVIILAVVSSGCARPHHPTPSTTVVADGLTYTVKKANPTHYLIAVEITNSRTTGLQTNLLNANTSIIAEIGVEFRQALGGTLRTDKGTANEDTTVDTDLTLTGCVTESDGLPIVRLQVLRSSTSTTK